MVDITVNLTPPLDGVVNEVGSFAWGPYQYLAPHPPSVAGVIESSSNFAGLPPGTLIVIRIPAQTVGGIDYEEAFSQQFAWDQTVFTDSIVMVEVTPPNGNGENGIPIRQIATPIVVGLAILYLFK